MEFESRKTGLVFSDNIQVFVQENLKCVSSAQVFSTSLHVASFHGNIADEAYCSVAGLTAAQPLHIVFVISLGHCGLEAFLCYLPESDMLVAEKDNKSSGLAIERAGRVLDDFMRDLNNPSVTDRGFALN
jgi:hypothetical protein